MSFQIVLFLWICCLTCVKSQDCTLAQFLSSDLYDSHFDTTTLEESYSAGKQVRVSCHVGFSGFFKLLCVEGRWQPKGTKCQPRSCGHPGDTQFADFHLEKGEDFVFGSTVVYTCQKGYQMVTRTNFRLCTAEGWNNVVPVCEAMRCPVIHLPDNVRVNGDPEESTYGNVVQFSCTKNNEILIGSTEMYCDENGVWSGQKPTCKEIECSVPIIGNGFISDTKTKYKEDEILHYECDARYKRSHIPAKCKKFGTKAEFTPTPACDEVTCSVTKTPGTSYVPQNNQFRLGDTVQVICSDGYRTLDKNSSLVSTCTDSGEWEPSVICEEIRCRPQKPKHVRYWYIHWNEVVRLGKRTSYYCMDGFVKASEYATCTRDDWSPAPMCREITCNREEIENTDIENDIELIYKYGQSINYVCKNGYKGRFKRTCQRNGWTGDIHVQRGCDRITIKGAQIIQNNWASYDHDDEVMFRCDQRDKSFLVKCVKGSWTGIQKCEGCSKPSIRHGFAVVQEDKKMYVACDDGFKLSTKGWWAEATCTDGRWTGVGKCIENSECADFPDIPNTEVEQGRSERGQEAWISCERGYRAQVRTLFCRDGSWDLSGFTLKTICIPNSSPCKEPPRIENAVITTPPREEYLSNSEVTYECRSKFSMEGENRIRCKDGRWEETSVTCTPPRRLQNQEDGVEMRTENTEMKERK